MVTSDVERFRKRAHKNGLVNCVARTMDWLRRGDPPAGEAEEEDLKARAMDHCLEKCAYEGPGIMA
jgi:hypothetical protein